MDVQMILLLLVVGSFVGFLSGLLGIGGGIIVVPVVLWAGNFLGFGDTHIHHIAVGTSFGVMIFTSFVSMITQNKRKSVRWDIARFMITGSIVGVLLGSQVASNIPTRELQLFYIIFCYFMAVKTVLPKPKNTKTQSIPGIILGAISSLIGFVSSILGIGGGVLNVPLLLRANVEVKKAVGTSSAISFFIGFFGFLGYVRSGWYVTDLPQPSLGYVNIYLTVCLSLTAIIFAPLGVRMSHRLPPKILKNTFAVLLCIVATKILIKWI